MKFGVNYIPSGAWLYRWMDWDAEAVERDLRSIHAIGLDHVRAHLIWPWFQLNPSRMCEQSMMKLAQFAELCEQNNLDFTLSLFTGWMSGSAYLPAWLTEGVHGRRRNMFADPEIIEAEKVYISEVYSVVGQSPRFLGFDLGNELSALTPAFDVDAETGDAWSLEMLTACEALAPGKLYSHGVDHTPWFQESGFSRHMLVNAFSVIALHCWTEFTGARARCGVMGVESVHIADFFVELAKACGDGAKRQYWIQEFGSTPLWHADGGDPADFLTATLDTLCRQEDVWGVTWWCSHDIDRRLKKFDELEYELGLFDADQRPKRTAEVLRTYVEWDRAGAFQKKRHRDAAVVLDEAAFNSDPWREIAKYMDAVRRGAAPAIVWQSRAGDKEYLSKRGIRELILE